MVSLRGTPSHSPLGPRIPGHIPHTPYNEDPPDSTEQSSFIGALDAEEPLVEPRCRQHDRLCSHARYDARRSGVDVANVEMKASGYLPEEGGSELEGRSGERGVAGAESGECGDMQACYSPRKTRLSSPVWCTDKSIGSAYNRIDLRSVDGYSQYLFAGRRSASVRSYSLRGDLTLRKSCNTRLSYSRTKL